MQKLIRTSVFRVVFLLALILLIGLLTLPHAAYAKSSVNKGFECKLLARDSGLPVTLITNKTHSVISSSGNSTLTCHFTYKGAGLPSKALKANKFLCGTYAGTTTDSKLVITPSGKITMTCHIKANKSTVQTQASSKAPNGDMSGVVFP
jgi:hypothetical protein